MEGVAEWENALRLFNAEVEFTLKADSEEVRSKSAKFCVNQFLRQKEMFRWKNALATLRVKEESKVVRKVEEKNSVLFSIY